MRMSSVQIFQQGVSSILAQQAQAARTEQQLATGRRILTPADDPVAAAQVLDITQDLERVDQYQRNANLAEGQLALEDTVLADVGNILQRVRELVVQANNASQGPETRAGIATEVEARIDELLALANTSDATGEYIFAGYQAQTQPFTRQGGGVGYAGDDGQRYLQVGNATQVAVRDSGTAVFRSVPTGNGTFSIAAAAANAGTAVAGQSSVVSGFAADQYSIAFSQATPADPVTYQVLDSGAGVVASGTYSDGDSIEFAGVSVAFSGQPADGDSFDVAPAVKQDMFSLLQGIVDDLNGAGTAPAEIAALNNALGQALNGIDQALGKTLEVRADVGVRLAQVENQLDINDQFNLQLQETLSGIQDLDYAEAISRFNLELTALQAAQQAYARMYEMSLFNYL
ncbi:MAG: flagellar hook-associated protein 3 [Halioglobus sp.]|nr:flagellar hook-associated protein 3 [Halioglobus sp.]|tara:strand:- start:1042 stop:2244 length:1203 start_codon:yes stop_codon:yes gene_type:complete